MSHVSNEQMELVDEKVAPVDDYVGPRNIRKEKTDEDSEIGYIHRFVCIALCISDRVRRPLRT